MEEDLLPADPDPMDLGMPELDVIEGLSLRMMQAMNDYQQEEHCCFMCGATYHFAWDSPHRDFPLLMEGAPKLSRDRSTAQGASERLHRSECSNCHYTQCFINDCQWANCTLGWS